MNVVTTPEDLRATLGPARVGRIGFVPTMGALHEGHLDLLRAARADNDTVVLSIFVNPTQFNDAADLAAYPRTTESDLAQAEAAGVDVVFLPTAESMYPSGFATSIRVSGPITETLEGAMRGAEHFDGVATVVAKLLLAVLPDAAYFGAKDAQQVVVVQRMVADLGIPVRIVVVPTARERDGLARSSRNVRLSVEDRARAVAVPRALTALRRLSEQGETDVERLRAVAAVELAADDVEIEYLVVVDPGDLHELATVDGVALVALAVRVGEIRLIDNITITAPAFGASETKDAS